MIQALCELVSRELGPAAEHVLSPLRLARGTPLHASDELEQATFLWHALAGQRPQSFGLGVPVSDTTPLGLALRHARRETPELVTELVLAPTERRQLAAMRAQLASWSGLAWPSSFSHLVFSKRCLALAETYTLSGGSGGMAFTFDPELGHVALYPRAAVTAYRQQQHYARLLSVLLHEETHLAAALAASGSRGPRDDVGLDRWENAAQLAQHVSYLTLRSGEVPTRARLERFLDGYAPRPSRFVSGAPSAATSAELIALAFAAAVDAAACAGAIRDWPQSVGPPISCSGSEPSSLATPASSSGDKSGGSGAPVS